MSEGKWDKIDSLMKRDDQSISRRGVPETAIIGLEEQTDKIRQEKLSLLGQFQRGTIQRKAAIEKLQSMYSAQLEVTKHALTRAVDVEKERVDLIANKYIFQITEEYLRDMQTLAMQNFKSRFDTVLQLNEETSKLLKKADEQDVPPAIKQKTLEAIIRKYEEFSAKLTEDEIRLTKR